MTMITNIEFASVLAGGIAVSRNERVNHHLTRGQWLRMGRAVKGGHFGVSLRPPIIFPRLSSEERRLVAAGSSPFSGHWADNLLFGSQNGGSMQRQVGSHLTRSNSGAV